MYRNAAAEDCEAIYRLICEMEQKQLPPDRFSAIYREQLGDRRFRCLVCESEGRVVGVLNLRVETQLHHAGPIAEIMELK